MLGTPLADIGTDEPEYAATLRDGLQSAYAEVCKNLKIAARTKKNYYDMGVCGLLCVVVDQVWCMKRTMRKGNQSQVSGEMAWTMCGNV